MYCFAAQWMTAMVLNNNDAQIHDETWRRLVEGRMSWEPLRARALILEEIRRYFRENDFLEVDTPIASPFPNLDPNIYPLWIENASGDKSRFYLHTSPEPAMKKLLAAGSGDIFYLGKVFRDREGSRLHSPEFTMLEWYRLGPMEGVMRDVEKLVRRLALKISKAETISRAGRDIPLERPWERRELSDMFLELLRTDMTDAKKLRAELTRLGARPGADESWEDFFFRAYIEVIEPETARLGTCFLTGFPASLGAMAKRRTSDASISDRFEGYIDGVELVNGYQELTDPEEQEARLSELSRRHSGGRLATDPSFIDALRQGLPECAGAALGVDRLVMLLLGKNSIADVMYT